MSDRTQITLNFNLDSMHNVTVNSDSPNSNSVPHSKQLAHYQIARGLIEGLARANVIEDVKSISDKAAAMKLYARVVNDEQLHLWVAEIRLRAKRRIGELSAGLPKASGKNLPNVADLRHAGKREVLEAAGISKDEAHRCEKIARIEPDEFERYIADQAAAKKPVLSEEVVKAVAKRARKSEVVHRAQALDILHTDDLGRLVARRMKFGTLYADPPWLYDDQNTRGAASDHYQGMTVEEIAALPLGELAADNAHLHLWTTTSFLSEAMSLMEKWGFEYKSCFVWVKPQMGMGHYWRVSHEFLLLGVRGLCQFEDEALMSWGQFDRGRHSAKPEEVRGFIERASPVGRLELFGRRPAPGWVVWGNEIERETFQESVERRAA